MTTNKTGYPHIDKPWLKYYSEEAVNAPLPEMTMYEYIWQNNKDYLEDIALEYYGTKISYRSLFDSIRKAANVFYDLGVRKGDIVTIMSMHTPECIYAIYGLNYIGATANLVYMTLAEKEIIDTINNTESKLLLVLDVALDKINNIKDQINIPIIILSVSDSMPFHIKLGYKLKVKPKKYEYQSFKRLLDSSKDNNPPQSKDHEAPAVIVYTSGTTGEPKGVVLNSDSFNSIVEQIRYTDRNDSRKDLVLHFLPVFLGFGLSMFHRCLSTGMIISLFLGFDGEAISKHFMKIQPNRIIAGPVILNDFMKTVKGDLSFLHEFTGGGAAIGLDEEIEFNDYLKRHNANTLYLNGYGMSEFCSAVATNQKRAYKIGSIGIPFCHVKAYVRDVDNNMELKNNEQGEMCFSTPSMMLKYYNNDAATNKIIEINSNGERVLHTGDLGYIDEDGFIYITGRIKRIYTTKSKDGNVYKLFPQRIEETVIKNKDIEICGCVAIPNEEKENIAILFIVLKNESNENMILDQLEELLCKELPEHSIPEKIIIIDKMPMTHSGKIDYQELERMYVSDKQ